MQLELNLTAFHVGGLLNYHDSFDVVAGSTSLGLLAEEDALVNTV